MNSSIINRPYRGEGDYARMLRLHQDVFGIIRGPVCCTAGELEWWRFQERDPDGEIASARLWETSDGSLAGYAWPGPTYVNLMAHPRYPDLLEAMLAWAEAYVRTRDGNRPNSLTTEAVDSDQQHVELLRRRGYQRTGESRDWRIRTLAALPDFGLPSGYAIRHLSGVDELDRRAALAEHPYAAHLSRAPTYRPDLNLAVVAHDGRFAAFCTAWLDEQNRVGVFEPVECLPEFRRQGLTRGMMSEGMRRLKRLGATNACIVNRCANIPAGRLYESLGFQAVGRISEWRKSLVGVT